uniref:hypothetical protein n=1 Tax=Neorhizobium sp. T25_13 TaxID=2093830 RepID=UPI00155E652D
MQDDEIRYPTDVVFNSAGFPEINGMRHNGQRWVDALRPDRPFVAIIPQEMEGNDIFGGTGFRTPPR